MSTSWVRKTRTALCAIALTGAAVVPLSAHAQMFGDPRGYHPINPTMAGKTLTLSGKDMTVEDVMDVSRRGEKVQYSPAAKQRMEDNYGLLLEAPAEGVSVYWFTRGAGGGRETKIFEGDPLRADNKAMLEKKMLDTFKRGADAADDPEIVDEALVRAVMVVRANAMTYNAPSPQLYQSLIDLLNKGVTPVMRSRGSVGEGDLNIISNIGATMVGVGEAYYQGKRMPAAQALAAAGLKPIQPFAADDNALTSSNAYFIAMTVFAVADAKEALAWADLNYAAILNGMNSSVTPLNYVVQTDRPFKWLNWDANRVKEMIKGSYLFGDDKGRIIQDPETLRASSIRQASAWQAWATLKDDLTIQLNSSDHNPAIRTDVSPSDSWDLNTPEMLKYYVKGGPNSKGKHGFIFSDANWDPYPIANEVEAFTIAMANMDIAIWQRDERFSSEFFTGPGSAAIARQVGGAFFGGYSTHEIWQHVQGAINPVPPEGYVGGGGVEELESQTALKAQRALSVVDDTFRMLAGDLNTSMRWLDVRKTRARPRCGRPIAGPSP
jgi:histidine ammonia-lyase